jgi:hypothetical protein
MIQRKCVPQGDASVTTLLNQHTILLGNLLGEVSNQGVLAATQTTLLAGSVDPGKVGEVAVHAAANDLSAAPSKCANWCVL